MEDVKILDGGFSAQLSAHVGAKIDGDPLWTARFLSTDPNAVYKTHLDFLRAGADIIETNTYQASVPGLMKHLSISEEQSVDLLRDAVNLAKNAVQDYDQEVAENGNVPNKKPQIAGACGPYGASLHDGSEYNGCYGKTTPQETMIEWHKPRVQALIDGGVDLLAFETIPCYQEADALVQLLKEFPNVKAWFSFSCQGNSKNMVDGSDFQEVATRCYKTALSGQIIAIGLNCLAPKNVAPLLRGINNNETSGFIPLVVYPNSGEKYTVETGWVQEGNDEGNCFESFIPEWLELGVRYLGGCCRVYAQNVESIRREVRKYQEGKTAAE